MVLVEVLCKKKATNDLVCQRHSYIVLIEGFPIFDPQNLFNFFCRSNLNTIQLINSCADFSLGLLLSLIYDRQ